MAIFSTAVTSDMNEEGTFQVWIETSRMRCVGQIQDESTVKLARIAGERRDPTKRRMQAHRSSFVGLYYFVFALRQAICTMFAIGCLRPAREERTRPSWWWGFPRGTSTRDCRRTTLWPRW